MSAKAIALALQDPPEPRLWATWERTGIGAVACSFVTLEGEELDWLLEAVSTYGPGRDANYVATSGNAVPQTGDTFGSATGRIFQVVHRHMHLQPHSDGWPSDNPRPHYAHYRCVVREVKLPDPYRGPCPEEESDDE